MRASSRWASSVTRSNMRRRSMVPFVMRQRAQASVIVEAIKWILQIEEKHTEKLSTLKREPMPFVSRRSYLDIIHELREEIELPLVAYSVSGEYAMIEAAAQGWIDRQAVILESLLSMKRAGVDLIMSYHATEVAKWLRYQLDACKRVTHIKRILTR